MVELKNIKKTNALIECDIVPEDSEEAGHMVVDYKNDEIISYKLPVGYEWCRNHVSHALDGLLEISKKQKMPKEKLIMWY